MKIIVAIRKGAYRSLKSWKGSMILWISSLAMVSLLEIPLKGALNAGFGRSMITEKLNDGFNLEVFADLGTYLNSLISYFSYGLFMLILAGIILNAFLTGGLFNALKETSGKYSSADFFRASSNNFWSFLIITLIISVIIFFLALFIIIVPVAVMIMARNPSGFSIVTAGIIASSIFLLFLPVLCLVADYARAWRLRNEKSSGFRALGIGFKMTFRYFLSSYTLIIIIIIVQILFGWLVLHILLGWRPTTGGGVFGLFLVSQLLFCFRLLLKSWRYACVTSLMEQNNAREMLFNEKPI